MDVLGATVSFTKLVVADLEASARFYRSVCGYGEGHRMQGELQGRAVEEIIFRRPDGGIDLILLSFSAPTSADGVILGLEVADLAAFEARVLEAGGSVLDPVHSIAYGELQMQMGVFADPEGFMLEVLQR